ncbi:MAG: hypothetical protein JNL81_01650 [Hyphomonadaceae bacterium]|nr:hypothetical protein [Hyphomonadaceae bacterium]
MGGFEFIFTFYSLLLGLAAANVATGLADVWRDRRGVALGWFVPVLGFIVLLLLMRQWVAYWNARELLTMTTPRLIMAACVALPFVFVSRLIFPGSSAAASLDDHFFAHRRAILVALAASPLAALVAGIVNWGSAPSLWNATGVLLPLALVPFKNRVVNLVGLMLLAARAVWGILS